MYKANRVMDLSYDFPAAAGVDLETFERGTRFSAQMQKRKKEKRKKLSLFGKRVKIQSPGYWK